MTDAHEPGPDETMPLPRATEPPASPELAAASPAAASPAAASAGGAGPAGAGPAGAEPNAAPAAGYVPVAPGAGYPPVPAGYVPGPAPSSGRSRVPLVAIVLGSVLVLLLAVGGGFAGGFVVGHAVGSRNGDISIQGPDRMMRGFDGQGESRQLSPRERKGTGMGNLPRLGGRVGPNSPAEPAPVPSPSN